MSTGHSAIGRQLVCHKGMTIDKNVLIVSKCHQKARNPNVAFLSQFRLLHMPRFQFTFPKGLSRDAEILGTNLVDDMGEVHDRKPLTKIIETSHTTRHGTTTKKKATALFGTLGFCGDTQKHNDALQRVIFCS